MKKYLTLILTVAVLATLLSGCGSKPAATTEATTAVATEATTGVDTVTTASIVDNADAVIAGLSADGTWIVATLNNLSTDKEIIVDGLFYNKDDTTSNIYRKLALYTQDADHKIIDSFTLTAPKMTVKSENFKIQGGTFIGDVYVEANGFNLNAATVTGNVYFASQEYMDSFVTDDVSVITGVKEVK